MFFIELVTGILLAIQFIPTASAAYRSVSEITTVIPFGFFVRNVHYWAGQLMVVFVTLHALRVVITGAYVPPRHFNWLIGVALLVFTLFVDFTGYLLIRDARADLALTIARKLAESIPLVGLTVASLLWGSADAGDLAVVRVYVWHAILLPILMITLMGWHFWRIRKDGGISGPL